MQGVPGHSGPEQQHPEAPRVRGYAHRCPGASFRLLPDTEESPHHGPGADLSPSQKLTSISPRRLPGNTVAPQAPVCPPSGCRGASPPQKGPGDAWPWKELFSENSQADRPVVTVGKEPRPRPLTVHDLGGPRGGAGTLRLGNSSAMMREADVTQKTYGSNLGLKINGKTHSLQTQNNEKYFLSRKKPKIQLGWPARTRSSARGRRRVQGIRARGRASCRATRTGACRTGVWLTLGR